MRKLLTTIDQANHKLLFWLIVASSIVLAARMQAIQNGWINPDSVLYLEAAKRIAVGDFQGAYKVFNWPFYALCIAAVHKISSFSIHLSAQFLNMVFFGTATAAFLKIIHLAGGKNLALFSGALLLFGNLYIVGDVLEMLMRDEGFWAFYLTSLVFFIRFYQQNKTLDALLWQVTAIISVLFRIEAISFLLFLPLTLLFQQDLNLKLRFTKLLKAYSISLLTLLTIFFTVTMIDSLSIGSFGRLNEVFSTNLWNVFTKNIVEKSSTMSEHVLGKYLEEYALIGLLLTFSYVIIVKNVTTLGLVSVVLFAMHLKSKLNCINHNVKRVLAGVSIICILNMMLIITKVFVLSSRYVVALTFILLIVASLYLGHLFKEVSASKKTSFLTFASIICIVLCLSVIKNIYSKKAGYSYMQDAVVWIKNNTHNKAIYYEDSRLRYYAGEPFLYSGKITWESVEPTPKNNISIPYDYLVLCHGKHHKIKDDLLNQALPSFKEVKRFYARKKRKYCAIYENNERNNHERKP